MKKNTKKDEKTPPTAVISEPANPAPGTDAAPEVKLTAVERVRRRVEASRQAVLDKAVSQ